MSHTGTGHTDIARGDWIDRSAPAPVRPYLRLIRLDRPIGTWLLLFPCWWSLTLADGPVPDLWYAALFAIGAFIMRGAGCVVNDLTDRKLDAAVERTRGRPLASGAISVQAALIFLAALLLAGLLVLVQFNALTIVLGIAALPLIAAYPWMKRITWWPQAFLGLTFNWGALLGWTAATGSVDPPALVLYAGAILWTLGYDTVYGHQDKDDDALIGVKSTARLFGTRTRVWLTAFYAGALVLFAAAVVLAGAGWVAVVALAAAGGHLLWQVRALDIDDPGRCLTVFRSNRFVGWLVLAAIVLGHLAAG